MTGQETFYHQPKGVIPMTNTYLTGLALHVYPRTKGELWDAPFTTFEVDEAVIIALEQELEE
jgi:hypothetical protein